MAMRKIIKIRSKKGFTLIELLVALLISGILMASVTSAFLMSQKIYTRGGDISYKQKSITNIETDLQNALATATAVSIENSKPSLGTVYGLGFNKNGDAVEIINGVEYKTDQITRVTVKNNGNTMNYEIIPKDSMSTLKGGIVMNNLKTVSIDTSLVAGTENYLVVTLGTK
nr:prepilin-type N-terminal cleavage/methylation domain-containing protein [uncultured Acetobacterium sp.]